MKLSYCPFCLSAVQTEVCSHCGNSVSYTGDPMHLQVGYVLNGMHSYVLGASLGQGGFGITYIALDIATNRRVAIKEYFPTYCAGRNGDVTVASYRGQEEIFLKGKERFLDEARMLKSLSDLPCVVDVIDFFEINNSAYLVMEFLEGKSLKDYVEQHGRIPAPAFLKRLKPLMMDMEKMHQRGVIHRDIAPDNIIMLPDGQLKLIDFGAARSYVGDKSMTVVVKKGFAPVEQYMRKGGNASTDIYALAATIYFCITGIIPPDSAERQYGEAELLAPTSLGVELSCEQERALEKALEIQPKDRIQSVAELAKALSQVPKPVTPKTEKSGPVPQKEKVQKSQPAAAPKKEPKKKAKWWIPVAAAAAVLCIGAGLLFAGKGAPSTSAQAAQMEAPQTLPAETEKAVQVSAEAVKYNEAVDLFKNGEYGKAAIAFGKLGDYRDAKEISFKIWDAIAQREMISAGIYHTVALKTDGTLLVSGKNLNLDGKEYESGQCDVKEWNNIVAIAAGDCHTVGLKNDGTVVATGLNTSGQCEVSDWRDIVCIAAGEKYTAGLKADGTVLCTGRIVKSAEKWNDITAIAGGTYFLAGLTADGTTVTTGGHTMAAGKNVVAIAAGENHDARLKSDGTIVSYYGLPDNGNMVAVFADAYITVGIQEDGTVVYVGSFLAHGNTYDLSKWKALKEKNIIAFSASRTHAVVLKSDGTADAYGDHLGVVKKWEEIRLPADRDALLAAIELDFIAKE